jgi:Mitochondrial branched-chain alpha-ketoacid dehydrogenase kinase
MPSSSPLPLLQRIQGDVASAAKALKRWSLRELASQQLPSTDVTHNVSAELLQCAVQRLAVQHESVRHWKEHLQTQQGNHSHPQTSAAMASTIKRLDTLQYVHADTYRLGKQILEHPSNILERATAADRHVINATFLEIRARHAKTVESIVDIVTEIRQFPSSRTHDDVARNERRADAFLRRRIGIQLLCDHHVDLHRNKVPNGGVTVHAPCVTRIVPDAVKEAQHVVDVHLPMVPEVIVSSSSPDIPCTMVQPWVHHALVELLKNAMASSVKQMQRDQHSIPSPVHVCCQEDGTDHSVTIDIVDAGTGWPEGPVETAFLLGHTTAAAKRWDRLDEQQSYAAVQAPLSSLGVGLPISRHLMEHFEGSLILFNNPEKSEGDNSRSGKGCTARVVLRKDDAILERYSPLLEEE